MPAAPPRHGAAVLRGLDGEPRRDLAAGRFGRLFPDRPACEAGVAEVEQLARLMERRKGVDPNTAVPAGFTYLGQFIDHDITFDPTPFPDRRRDPRALVNFRTARLDLDSVYGLGPAVQPYLYDWTEPSPGARLLEGHNMRDGCADLPRNQQGRALIGDPRNDENVIVSQLHLLLIRFHNAVVAHLERAMTPEEERWEAARRTVCRHYQWIVVHDFLSRVAGEGATQSALARRDHVFGGRRPFIPVEFSVAAYRFGHSMVRADYGLKRLPPTGSGPPAIPLFPDLAGFGPLSRRHVIDWERFFDVDDEAPPQRASTIDTSIARPLFELPDGDPQLPRRTLLRGVRLGLPSGQEVAQALEEPALEEQDLRLDDGLEPGAREVLERSTPLWYYVLCEAEKGGGEQLGPVGGRIVADVLVGLLRADAGSYLDEKPAWRPGELGTGPEFSMRDMVRFVREALTPGRA